MSTCPMEWTLRPGVQKVTDSHSTEPIIEQIMRNAGERDQARRRVSRRSIRLRFRKSMATLLIGTASVGLAIVMLIVTVLGLFGLSIEPWTEPRKVLVEKSPR